MKTADEIRTLLARCRTELGNQKMLDRAVPTGWETTNCNDAIWITGKITLMKSYELWSEGWRERNVLVCHIRNLNPARLRVVERLLGLVSFVVKHKFEWSPSDEMHLTMAAELLGVTP